MANGVVDAEYRSNKMDAQHASVAEIGEQLAHELSAVVAPASRPKGLPKRSRQCFGSGHPEVPPRSSAASIVTPAPETTEAPPAPASEDRSELLAKIGPERRFAELVRRASSGNPAMLAALKQALNENPEIWQSTGNVCLIAEKAWLDLISDGNALVRESIPRKLEELKAELAGKRPSPIEKLLVDFIGVTWMAANHAELQATTVGDGIQVAALRLKRAESASKRLLTAVKTLATVRAMIR